MHDNDWYERYDGYFDPADYSDFLSVEDRDDLADLSLEPCEQCGGKLRAYGVRGRRVILDCAACKGRSVMTMEGWGDSEEEEMWDDEEEDN